MNNQESTATRDFRTQQRANAFMRKNGRCDLCHHRATDYHEIYFRSASMNNEEARRLSFQEAICAILCQECHSHAHNTETSMKLLLKNSHIYGVEAVNHALMAVQGVLKGRLGIPLLDEEVVDG